MAWGFVQAPTGVTGGTSPVTMAFASNVATGNRIVALTLGYDLTGTTTVDSTLSHTGTATVDSWTTILGPVSDGGAPSERWRIWTAYVIAGGTMTLSCAQNGGSNPELGVMGAEYSGLSSASGVAAMDVSASSVAGGTSASSGATAATTVANELVLGFFTDAGLGATLTAGTGFTQRMKRDVSSGSDLMIEDKDSGASGTTQTATFTSTDPSIASAICVVMKLAAVTVAVPMPVTTYPRISGLGVG